MFKMPNRFPALWIAATMGLAAIATPARAQQPTDEQRSAIRSSCRSDYMAHCASVPPGGLASLQCLQQNMASLSAACKSAVNAVATPKEVPKAETAPAAPKAETRTEPKTELKPNTKAEPKAEPKAAPAAPKAQSTPAAAKPAAPAAKPGVSSGPQTAAAPPTPPLILRPIRPLEEVRVLRFACGADARTLCSAVQPGGGRIIQCLASQPDALSAECKEVLGQFAAQ